MSIAATKNVVLSDESPILNVAMIGHAFMGRAHSNAYRQVNHFFDLPFRVVAKVVVGRALDRAGAAAAKLGFEEASISLEEVLARDDIDLVDVATPNDSHFAIAMAALKAGKHVLCEKPLALSLAQAQAMFDAARQHRVMLLEAFPYYFQPQTGAMLALLARGEIGQVRSVQASFGFTMSNPVGNIRLQPDLGGGALLDAGCYALSLIRLVMGVAPQRVRADASWAASGVDMSLMASLYYADGRRAQLSCAMDVANHRHATVVGTWGTLETEYLNHTAQQAGDNAYGYLPGQLRVRRGTANTIAFEDIACGVGSGFAFAAEAFAGVVQAGDFAAIERAASASLDNAATLEALGVSARSGHAVELPMPSA